MGLGHFGLGHLGLGQRLGALYGGRHLRTTLVLALASAAAGGLTTSVMIRQCFGCHFTASTRKISFVLMTPYRAWAAKRAMDRDCNMLS